MEFTRPRVVVSRCLGFAACRYNAQVIHDDFVAQLAPHVEFIEVCPEEEIGLGTPREPIRLVRRSPDSAISLLQPATGRDVTTEMQQFATSFLERQRDIDGFVLKNRSPSCGTAGVKVYPDRAGAPPAEKAPGMFAAAVLERFAHTAIEDEGRLRNRAIREHFLTRLYALARLRTVVATGTAGALVDFHGRYKYVLMTYSQQRLRTLGRIVANVKQAGTATSLAAYRAEFAHALARPPRAGSHINTMMHILGYFSEGLAPAEKALLLDMLQQYHAGAAPLASPLAVLRAWTVRFEQPYLSTQAYFEPFPRALASLADSGAR